MRTRWQKYRRWIIPFCLFPVLLILMDSCLQFRMSKSEINTFFEENHLNGSIHRYPYGKRTMNYAVSGDTLKPAVIFVHGSPGSLSAFIHFLADSTLLKEAVLISVDRPGFGASDFGYAEPSLQKQAAMLKPILQRFQKNRPLILVGHSSGGPLIGRMAMDYPELIDGLVMVAPSLSPDLEPHEWFRAPLATPFLKWMLPRSIRASNDEIYKLKPELEKMMGKWSSITVPTIVIQGKKDNLVPYENAEFAVKMMTHAPVSLVINDDMNHFVPWTHPALIRDAVVKLLSDPGVHQHAQIKNGQ